MSDPIRELNFKFYEFLLLRDIKRTATRLSRSFNNLSNELESTSESLDELADALKEG